MPGVDSLTAISAKSDKGKSQRSESPSRRRACDEKERTEEAVDDGDAEEDSGSRTESADEVGRDGQETDDGTTKDGRGRDDALQLLVHRAFAVAGDDHLLVLELLGNVARARTRDLDPGLAEQGARRQHERDVDRRVDRIGDDFTERARRRHVVDKTGSGEQLGRVLERLRTSGTSTRRTRQQSDSFGKHTSQTPMRRTSRFSGKRLNSIWLTMKTLLVKADSSIILQKRCSSVTHSLSERAA